MGARHARMKILAEREYGQDTYRLKANRDRVYVHYAQSDVIVRVMRRYELRWDWNEAAYVQNGWYVTDASETVQGAAIALGLDKDAEPQLVARRILMLMVLAGMDPLG